MDITLEKKKVGSFNIFTLKEVMIFDRISPTDEISPY